MASEGKQDLWGFLFPECAVHRGDLFQLPFSEAGQGVLYYARAECVRAKETCLHIEMKTAAGRDALPAAVLCSETFEIKPVKGSKRASCLIDIQ